MTTVTKIPPAPTWDIESIFPDGSGSTQFKDFRDKVKATLGAAVRDFADLSPKLEAPSFGAWRDILLLLQSTAEDIELIEAMAGCLTCQNVADDAAHAIQSEADLLHSEWEKFKSGLEALSLKQSDEEWDRLVSTDELKTVRFFLNEMRQLALEKMPVEQEALALDLGVNGYHAWNRLYDKMAGDLQVEFPEDGRTENLSLGQLATKMSDPDREIRSLAFRKMTEAWESRADLAAMTLNAQAGFRLALYNHRGWESPLYEPLTQARLTEESLNAMWSVVSRESQKLVPYIEAKKRLLGIDKYRWYDEFAPCGKTDRLYSFEEATDFIVNNVGGFSSDMAGFVRMAVDKRWVEAEDRPGKAAGAWCTGLGPIRQSRIFMTYSGTFENLLTLAHELGHGYHQYLLKDTPHFASRYPMTLAETASIFAEQLVTDAALDSAVDPKEKLMLLDQKLQAAYILFADLQSRFLFDKMFYAERKEGTVGKDRLCEMMVEAQKQAFGKLLDESGYHPLFWASKLHFYLTDRPFYNYPYTFGYLFAGGVYDRARKEGSAFADKYRALLADTGAMTSEQVATKHLGVDLTQTEFWEDAVSRSLVDVKTFVELAGNM